MNLFSQEIIDSANQAMKDMFDTFTRDLPVRFYKSPTEIVVVDPNYSPDWDSVVNKNIKTAEYRDFKCRVFYEERQEFENLIQGADSNIRYKGEYNRIKLHMELDAFEYVKNTQRFVFDGLEYNFDGTYRGLGILGAINFYEIKLIKVN